jgi:spore coat polysaccharide biosynthesis protein SpsF
MVPVVRTNLYDFISNVRDRSFPTGMSVEFLRTSFYHDLIHKFNTSDYFEHVTLYLYEHEDEGRQYHFYNYICPEGKGRKFAIDTLDDFKTAEKLLLKITNDHTEYDICDWVKMDE